jgi:Transposase DDE domain group 1
MNTGFFANPAFSSEHPERTSCIPQLSFSFYRHRSIRADFSGGQITSDAGLLPLRAFDQRHGLTCGLAECVGDDRDDSRVSHAGLSLLRQRLYQIIAGYEDANDADRLRHDPAFQILADQTLGEPLGSQPTFSRWENSPSPRDHLKLQDALLDWFVQICGAQIRKRGEILLDVDSTDDPTYGQQQLSFFNGGYGQHMYHPLLIFERHTGCLLAARLRRGTAASHARIIPLLLRIVPRLQREFPKARIQLRADAGFALPLYEFCEFFSIQYTTGVAANSRLQEKAQRLQRRLARRYRRTGNPQRSFPAFSIALTAGLVSGASATKRNTPNLEPTCVSWSPTSKAAAVPPFPSIRIAGNARIALKNSKTVLLRTA